mmetsp:Transcript_62207/g.140330  ORF Transcript_62207/g.140330 Transcript_62207/m.140330 type:complete len:231 (-) Transcript_62207:128-820(-)
MSAAEEAEIVYLTGDNAVGKTSLGQHIADMHSEWHCVDGDEFVDNDPELKELCVGASGVINLMRDTFGEEQLSQEVKKHDAEVSTAWEPFFRALFDKLKQIKESKIVFVYHCWRQWTVDVFREYFPTSKFVEVQVTRNLLLDRFVNGRVKNGVNHETLWRDDQREHMVMVREKYGPEYKGNEDNYKKFAEWRYFFCREPFWEEQKAQSYVVSNDNFDGAQDLERILYLTT